MPGNSVRFTATLDDKVSAKLGLINKSFDKTFGKGSSASLWGNVGAKAVAKGFDIVGGAMDSVVGFALDSVDAFSKLEQATGGVQSVFGASAKAIEDFAATASDSVGLSKRAVSEMAAVIGAKLEGLGFSADEAATKTIALEVAASDLAATFGGTTSDAIEAISALLTGERDPIEKYGVSIKEADVKARILALGLDTSTTAANKQAVAIATLSLLEDQTSKATGQFAAQTNTLAEKQQIANAKMENAQAVLGEKLAPIMLNITNFMISDVIPAIYALGRGWDKFTTFIGDSIDALNRFSDALGRAIGLESKLKGKYHPPAQRDDEKHHAEGGWVGLRGPETIQVGERGPEYVNPAGARSRRASATAGTVPLHSHEIVLDGHAFGDAVDKLMFRRARRQAPTSGNI